MEESLRLDLDAHRFKHHHGHLIELVILNGRRESFFIWDTSVGISTTGYAGPTGGTEENPVGTVYIGLSWEGGETVFRPDRRYMRTREQVRRHAASHALDLVRREVLK